MPRFKFDAEMEIGNMLKLLLTDDGIPVRTVYVTNLNASISIEDLKKFCELKFGAVSAVRIHQIKNKNQNPRHLRSYNPLAYAFVTFNDTAAAYNAVHCRSPAELLFNGRPLRIRKADSWHQPTETVAHVDASGSSTAAIAGPSDGDAIESQVINEQMDTSSDSNSPLVNLIDDCLHEIFKYLNIFDTVNTASTCKRLRYFVNENVYQKYVKLELSHDLLLSEASFDDLPKITLGVLRTMLQHFGSIVEEIDLHASVFNDTAGRRHLQFVLRYCPNLHTLRLRSFAFRRNDQIVLSKISSKVKVIELHDCDGIDDWADVLRNFTELRTLIISSNSDITGKLLSKCKKLERLDLIDCYAVRVQEMNKFCTANGSSLRTLKLLNCSGLDHTVYQMISNKLLLIEDLTIEMNNVTGPNQLNCLAQLDNLKKLFIVCSMYNIGTYLRMLGDRGLLEELTIYGGTLDAETCGLLQKFHRLKSLTLLYPLTENEHMMDIIESVDLPELREFYCEACNSVTNANLVALITSKRNLSTVDILFSCSVTFAAVRQIIEILKSDVDRPFLNLNIDTLAIGDEENKFLHENRDRINVTTLAKCRRLDEHYPGMYDDMDEDDDDDFDIDTDTDDDDYDIDEYGFAAWHGSDDDDHDNDFAFMYQLEFNPI